MSGKKRKSEKVKENVPSTEGLGTKTDRIIDLTVDLSQKKKRPSDSYHCDTDNESEHYHCDTDNESEHYHSGTDNESEPYHSDTDNESEPYCIFNLSLEEDDEGGIS